MLVIISDLHLQHIADDVVRYRRGADVLEVGVRRNVGARPLHLLFAEIADNVARSGAKQVDLVLAGDIFELMRTPVWFYGGLALRPISPIGDDVDANPMRAVVENILHHVAQENLEFFGALQGFSHRGRFLRGADDTPESLPSGVTVTVHFIPGNHDRLVDAWPSIRARIRTLLGMAEGDQPFPRTVERPGVLIRHGHEYDDYNNGGLATSPPTRDEYLKPCFGDFVTVDVAARLAVAFRAHYGAELRASDEDGRRMRELYLALTEFDDLRPASLLLTYLAGHVETKGEQILEILRPILRDVFETARASAFLRNEVSRLGTKDYLHGVTGALIDDALKTLSAQRLTQLITHFAEHTDGSDDAPATRAAHERGLAEGTLEVVVAGHTHAPDQVALVERGHGRHAAYFLDSGTWRTRMDQGVGNAFGRLRAYTMVFVYQGDEYAGERRFETWTGHLVEEGYGVYEKLVAPTNIPRAAREVRFLGCEVRHVDEGSTHDGAELQLTYGVDGIKHTFRKDHVHDGEVLDLRAEPAIALDPALDGDVWLWGLEEDFGDSTFDRDDPLPWVLDRLPRDATGHFAVGDRKLTVDGVDGTQLVVRYRVENQAE